MENQLQTIVCPNCGANATNHHNCEYCGSFLVQRAAQGMDVSNYVLDAARFRSSVLEAVLQKYTDFFMKYPDSGLCWELDWNGKTVLALSPASYYSSELGPGYAIDIKSDALQDANAYGRFLNSSAFKVFDSYSGLENEQGKPVDLYLAIFGFDYKGAMRLILQLLEEVYQIPYEETDSSIFAQPISGNIVDSIDFNSKGEIVKRGGLGRNDFEGIDAVTSKTPPANNEQGQQEVQKSNKDRKKKVWSIIVSIICILIYIIISYL